MKCLRAIVAAIILLCCNFYARAQDFSNQGTEFYTAYMDHISGAAGAPGAPSNASQMDLYITGDYNTTATVSIADGSFTKTVSITANGITTVQIPASAFLDAQGKANKGIHITSLKSVAVYAHIFGASVSGATLLLPVNTLGKDYLSINYKQLSNSMDGGSQGAKLPSYSTFMVIGTEDNTTVEITPSVPLLDGTAANTTFTIHLKKGEVYQGLANTDLTGTRIRSVSAAGGTCKKIAVFSGSSKIGIGCRTDNFSSDNLFQQVYPTATWGKNYITVPLSARNYDIFRVVISQPDTKVLINGNSPSVPLVGGLYYEFPSTIPNVISADKTIQVAQYAVTQGKTIDCTDVNNDIGDPEMIYLTPIEQTLDHVTLNSTSNFQIINNYINVIIPSSAVGSFSLDGEPNKTFVSVPNAPAYSYAQIQVNAGVHNIKAAEGFNAIAYGFGKTESYGYAAGANLKNLNEFIALEDPSNNVIKANGCTGITYKLQLTLPFKTTDIKWDFKNGTIVDDANPVAIQKTGSDGKILYIYQYGQSQAYTNGDYTVVATVFNPIADDCGSSQDIEFDFNISDQPTTDFDFSNTCFGDEVAFNYKPDPNSRIITKYSWDFGDGQTSIEETPTHKYQHTGDFYARLTVTNENDCSTVSNPKLVHIGIKPRADFKALTPDCPGLAVNFTDKSLSPDGAITSWVWDYGDGSAQQTYTQGPFSHSYTSPGSYVVKLIITNANGCISDTVKQTIVIHPLPEPDFLMPDVCISDTYAQFKDNSTITDGTDADFTYLWDFGDSNASSANPNTSTERNARHKYTEAKTYNVTLTVKSKYGCEFQVQHQFTVNGANPKAALTVLNPNDLCSNREVFFANNSTVDFGKITKLVVTYDVNDPNSVKEYDYPEPGLELRYKYPQFTDATRNITVRVVAYSGISCADLKDYPITLKASPLITFAPIPGMCPEGKPLQLTPLTLDGPPGSGVYSGTGVSSSGLFNPAVSGAGTFDIKYIYTSQNSCADTIPLQVTVYPSPTVNAGNDFTMLEGDKVRLRATADGHNLTYKWYPSTGLDHDDVLNPVTSPAEDITYQLIVTSAEGCAAMSKVNVTVLKYLQVPNVFTPNGDGINDLWVIKYLETYPNNTVEVYNRYGEKLYSSIGYNEPWDGRYKGAYLPPGTYYYIINPKNGRKVISGNVTIIR